MQRDKTRREENARNKYVRVRYVIRFVDTHRCPGPRCGKWREAACVVRRAARERLVSPCSVRGRNQGRRSSGRWDSLSLYSRSAIGTSGVTQKQRTNQHPLNFTTDRSLESTAKPFATTASLARPCCFHTRAPANQRSGRGRGPRTWAPDLKWRRRESCDYYLFLYFLKEEDPRFPKLSSRACQKRDLFFIWLCLNVKCCVISLCLFIRWSPRRRWNACADRAPVSRNTR